MRQLEVFVAISRNESVSNAANALALTQSATSMALAELENQFDQKLFDRTGKKLQLNETGKRLLPKAMDLLDRAREIEHSLRGETNRIYHLKIGTTLTIGNYLATQLIGEFLQHYPGSQLQMTIHNTEMIAQNVLHFACDIGLIEGNFQHPDLESLHWLEDELVIFASPTHPLAKKRKLTMDDLRKATWIVREPGSGTRQTFDYAMRHVLSELNIQWVLEQTEAIKRAVESGFGISCVSKLALTKEFQYGELVPLRASNLDLKRQFHILLHRQKFRTEGIEKFLAFCQLTKI